VVPLPVGGLIFSALVHAALIVAVVFAVRAIRERHQETYFVNLVPAVAAVGSPQGTVSTPAPPTPRAPDVPAKTPDLPARETPRHDLPPRDLPPRPRDLSLPDRNLPPRVTTPRRDQKELPTLASNTPTTAPSSAPTRDVPAAPPPQPSGQPTGSTQGAGKATVDVDFPYAWYLSRLVSKINERWDDRALPGNQPIVAFEIGRNGQVDAAKVKIEKSSGNPAYDYKAVRAIVESTPFPPLPDDFKAQYLNVHLQFNYSRGG
jgi:TonB family protein